MTLRKHFQPQTEEKAAMREVTLPLFTIHFNSATKVSSLDWL